MSNSDKGYEFEKYVAKLLNRSFTARSGAHWDDGDIKDKDFIIECKYKTQPNLTFPKGEREKLQTQAKKYIKDWIYIQRNNSGDQVVMSLDTFATLLHRFDQRL